MTDEVEGNFENNIIYQFWKKGINSKKIRHHCHLTGQYRGPAHHKWRKKFYTEKSNFIPFVSIISLTLIVIYSLRSWLTWKKDEVKNDEIPKNKWRVYISNILL